MTSHNDVTKQALPISNIPERFFFFVSTVFLCVAYCKCYRFCFPMQDDGTSWPYVMTSQNLLTSPMSVFRYSINIVLVC